jgi:hypothetical protein
MSGDNKQRQLASSFNEDESDLAVKMMQQKSATGGTVILASGSMNKLQGFGLSHF